MYDAGMAVVDIRLLTMLVTTLNELADSSWTYGSCFNGSSASKTI